MRRTIRYILSLRVPVVQVEDKEQAEARASRAEARVACAEARNVELKARATQAEAKAEDLVAQVQAAKERTTKAESRATEAESRATEAESRATEATYEIAHLKTQLQATEKRRRDELTAQVSVQRVLLFVDFRFIGSPLVEGNAVRRRPQGSGSRDRRVETGSHQTQGSDQVSRCYGASALSVGLRTHWSIQKKPTHVPPPIHYITHIAI